MYISFSGNRGDELFLRFNINEDRCVFHGFESLIPMWEENFSRSHEATIDLLSESVLIYTFSRIYPEARAVSDVLSGVVKYIDDIFFDPGISMKDVAERFSYNAKYLSHLFKKAMGISFSEYLKNTRLKYAIFLIDQGVTSVKNISILTGYTDPLYFSKLFKEKMGIAPKGYILQKYGDE